MIGIQQMGVMMNRSKLYEWLLDNECPFEWDVDEDSSTIKTVTLIFSKKEWEDPK